MKSRPMSQRSTASRGCRIRRKKRMLSSMAIAARSGNSRKFINPSYGFSRRADAEDQVFPWEEVLLNTNVKRVRTGIARLDASGFGERLKLLFRGWGGDEADSNQAEE